MRKNISIDDVLAGRVDSYCAENNYGFSELISELLRHRIMGVDIKPLDTHVLHNKVKDTQQLHKKDDVPPKKDTIPTVPIPAKPSEKKWVSIDLKSLGKVKSAPMFCPKHRGMRMGTSYTCGCPL